MDDDTRRKYFIRGLKREKNEFQLLLMKILLQNSLTFFFILELEFKQSPEERCNGETCGQSCQTHSDCPSMMNCYTDHLCRDPCSYSIRCGKNSNCKVIDNVPECYCPPGFIGDATKECINR